MERGWVKLHRKLTDWEWYTDVPTKTLFIHLLLTANHEEKSWHGMTVPVGGLITSRAKLSEGTGLTEKQVRTALRKLISTGEVASKSTQKYTLLIVKNYSEYQDRGQQRANKGPTKGQQRANKGPQLKNERIKELKNERIIPPYPPYDSPADYAPADEIGVGVEGYTTNPDLRKSLFDFIDMRQSKGIATPPNVLAMLFDELNANGKDDQTKIQVVRQSITNGWKGFFPLSGNREPEQKDVPDWYGDTGENDAMDPALLEKALRIQRELQ